MRWINEEAKRIYDKLDADREMLAIKMGLVVPTDEPQTATALKARLGPTLRTAEAIARSQYDYDLAVKPITDEMVRLASMFTIPKPIVVMREDSRHEDNGLKKG